MAILTTVKKFIPYVKTTAGYVAYRLSSQAVQMDNGKTLEATVSELNSKLNNISQKIDSAYFDLDWYPTTETDALKAALSVQHAVTYLHTVQASTNIPNNQFLYSPGLVFKRTNKEICIVLFARNGTIGTNFWNGSSWTGWNVR